MKPIYITNAAQFGARVTFGTTRESESLEFKETYRRGVDQHKFELRKDVSAFANTWGGTLLIGVSETTQVNAYAVADDAVHVDQEAMIQWVTSVLATGIFPRPMFDPVPLTIKNRAGNDVQILAVNVHPYVDGIGCYEVADCSLRFARRDAYGVKFFHALEVFEAMSSSRVRRINLLLNELAATGQSLEIISPFTVERMETEEEWLSRLKGQYGNVTWSGQQVPLAYQKRIVRMPADRDGMVYGEHDSRHVKISRANNYVLNIPLGLVREVWPVDTGKLGIVLDCEIVESRIGSQKAWQRGDEAQTATNPIFEHVVVACAFGRDVHITSHRLAGEVHWPHEGLLQRIGMTVRADSHHQIVLHDSDEHLAPSQKSNPTEHLFLGDCVLGVEHAANPFCQTLVIRHRCT